MKMMIAIISLLFSITLSQACMARGQNVQPSSCFLDTSYKLASSKTDYSFVGNKTNMQSYFMPGCVQVGMWHLSRHGGRYPDSDDIQAMNNLSLVLQKIIVEKNASWLCEADRVKMRNWQTKMTNPDQGNYLTDYGRRQMRELGNRMYLRLFNDIIATGLNISTQLKVSVTELIRTQQSADEYLNGLLNYASARPTYDVNEINGYLLKYPDYCKKYIRDVKKSPTYCPELNVVTQNWTSMKIDKQTFIYRLGVDIFELGLDLEETFDLVLKMCQYEYLIDGTDSVWCKFFDQDTLKRQEYQEDIDYNCAYGYRYNISQFMTCDLVKNMLSNLNQMKQGKKIQLLFSHTSTLLSFYGTLGIARDSNNFDMNNILNENKSRKYRTSLIDPMNTNIAIVVYKCSSLNSANQQVDKYKVRAFMSENLLTLEACQSTECDLDQFVNYYQSFVNQCQSTEASCAI